MKVLSSQIQYGVPLARYTSLGVGGPASALARAAHESHVEELVAWAKGRSLPVVVLGGGSNAVVSDAGIHGLVILMEIQGISVLRETDDYVEVAVGAGESWDRFVEHAVTRGWWGVENMSLVPGTVGAVAVQNVSAYGQSCSSVIVSVRAYDVAQDKFVELSNNECRLGFRSSVFNTDSPGRYIIVRIVFRLHKNGKPQLNRKPLARAVAELRAREQGGSAKAILDTIRRDPGVVRQAEVRAAVIRLRTSGRLLPLPGTVGNAGTFFRASIIPHERFPQVLRTTLLRAGLRTAGALAACRMKLSSPLGVKVPSNRLIVGCGLAGASSGGVSLYPPNCAVLIADPDRGATAADVVNVIRLVRTEVFRRTGVVVPIEPTLLGFSSDELKTIFEV